MAMRPHEDLFSFTFSVISVIERNSTTLAITCISSDYKESDGV